MTKIKVAILEDSKFLLKELKQDLDRTQLVNVVAWALNSNDFLEKIQSKSVEALILDIDISGDSMTGIDIANKLSLPVLFVSGKTKDFFERIEDLNLNSDKIIEHISKPITIEKLNKILPKFIAQIDAVNSTKFVFLNLKDIESEENTKRVKIQISDIVYIGTDKNMGAKSNNKVIYFSNRRPALLIDFSFTKMEEIGLSLNRFIITHKSYRVNENKIEEYDMTDHAIKVKIYNEPKLIKIPVSENYRRNIQNHNY